MKKILLIMLMLLTFQGLQARELTKEWREYFRLVRRDRPRDEIAKLHEIRALALERKYPEDFLDACRYEERTYSRLNWKSTDSLHTALLEIMESYGQPMLTFRWLNKDWDYALAHHEELSSGRHPDMQDRYIPFMQTRDEDDIEDDFEWILWDRIIRSVTLIPDSEEYRLLSERIGDRYPARPYLSFLEAKRADDRLAAMQALAEQYADDPFRFLPGEQVLQERLSRLQKDDTATEDDYKALYDDAREFAKAAKAEKGIHQRQSISVEWIINSLSAKSLNIRFRNDSIVLIGRNFGRGALTFQSEDNHRNVTLRNRDGSFYILDTVMAPVPELPDGSYTVSSTNPSARASYEKHTISMAVRRLGDDFAVYVTDYQTGEPFPSATICLRHNRKTLEREIPLDGFTVLPADFQKMIGKKKVYTLEARVGERRSPTVGIYRTEGFTETDLDNTIIYGRIYKDRGAYRPGDTLKAKAVLFEGDLHKQVKTVQEGEDVRVHIFNAEGKTLTDINLKTNSFGSVAWEFPIPVGERNGLFGIYVYYKKSNVAHSEFLVDDFVLPTFEVTFDPQEKPFIADKEFEIGGKVVSYSGHPVDGIALEGRVTRYGTEVWKGPVSTDIDGSFRILLPPSQQGPYVLNIKALDATGETREFEHRFQLTTTLSLDVELENPGEGEFFFRHAKYEDALLTEPVGLFAWTVKNGNEPINMPVVYQLTDVNGRTVLEGRSEETFELDMSSLPDGLYFIRGIVEAGGSRGRVDKPVLKMTSGLDAPVRSLFLPGDTEVEYGDAIRARLGAGGGPLWAVATLSAPDGKVLETRLVHLDGTPGKAGSISDLTFDYKDYYPDLVRLEVFYFCDSGQFTHEEIYHRVRHSMDLPLAFSRFVDQTMPGAPVTLSLQTDPGAEVAVAVYDKSLDAMGKNEWNDVKPQPPLLQTAWFQPRAGFITAERPRTVFSGGGSVYGIVIDPEGEPVIGSAVLVEGTVIGTVTDLDGLFTLEVPTGTLLEISSIGYKTVFATAAPGMQVILEEDVLYLDETIVVGYGTNRRNSLSELLSGRVAGIMTRVASSAAIYGSAIPVKIQAEELPEVAESDFRAVFSEALAFEPLLYPDESGKVEVSFRASDKISTYHVNVFAHDRSMHNALLQRNIVVTIPVRVSVTPPRYLYEGDSYELSASVSSLSEEDISGRLYLQTAAGEDREVQVAELSVPAGGSAAALFTVAAPTAAGDPLDLRLVFESGNFSDAIRFNLPINQAAQTITESHSAMAGPEAVDSLRRMFVNAPGEMAEVKVRTLRKVAEEGLAQWTAPEDSDALSLSADFYARALLGRDTTGTLAPLMALRREDGGFAWMEGMESSPSVTATLLERFAVLRDKGIAIPDMTATVHYLDISQFGNLFPMWCGGVSDEQYMDIRAMWTSIPFDLKDIEEKAVRRFRLRDFRQFARAYLTPGRYDFANGWILDKARRVRTLQNLTASDAGIKLGTAWGEVLFTAPRFENTISNDLISLEQYAVRHPSGGLYYPNAVLPYRGLLSSEVYAHTLLASLLEGPVAEGIKLWLILQNETQSWTEEPAYVEALQAVLTAPDSVLDRQIVTLTTSTTIPFEEVKASGNGMRIERRFYLVNDGNRTEVQPGDTLRVGDRLIASYELWSAENRSFVRVDAFREAGLQPVEQRSGPLSSSFRPIRIDGLWTRLPQAYRDIRADRTLLWFDVCPEESATWEESFYVTQAGTFTAPVVTVESLYAPKYRANGSFRGPLTAE
jgi:hypothetical protein